MFHKTTARDGNDSPNTPFLSSNHRVVRHLNNTSNCPTDCKSFIDLCKTSSHIHDSFDTRGTCTNDNHLDSQQHMCSCSENDSSLSVIETLPEFDSSFRCSQSDPGGYCSMFSSNTSSSGVCSTFSDIGHEENASTSCEDLDFNLGFDWISDNDDIEVANFDEVDECERNGEENQLISTKNNGSG